MALASLLNPYTYIAGAVVVAAIGGSLYYQSATIHSYHVAYDNDEKIISALNYEITQMTTAQKNQTKTTGDIVTKVVKVPGETQVIVKTIHDAPVPASCTTPAIDTLRNET